MTVSGPVDARIAAIAAAQRGRVARRQLLAAGIRAGAITHRLATGRLVRVQGHRAVYGVGHLAPAPLTRETEALLALRPGAVVSHESALVIWGLWSTVPLVHVSVVRAAAGRPSGVRVHRVTALAPRDLRIRDGLPVTSPSRSLYDSSPALTARELERAFEEGARRGLVTVAELAAHAEQPATCRAARRRVRELLQARTTSTFTRSEAEERFLALVRAAGLPTPLVNARRHGYELDFLWARAGVAVEVDGFAFHGGRDAFERDRRRDADLLAAGIVVVRVTWRQLTDDSLATITRIAQLLAVRGG